MVVKDFKDKVLFIDTSPLIYFIEGHTGYQSLLLKLFTSVDKGDFSFITSTITLLEVLVKPLQDDRQDIVTKYTEILTTAKGIDIFDINIAVSKEAANLRAKYKLRTPDAIQIATAIIFGADIFLTNDTRLRSVSEIKIVVLSEIQ
jgi:predicted nucleic acid-binding protein